MKLGAITLQNSVCLATAPWDLDGSGYEQLGAIFTKTVTMEPRAGLPGDDGVLQVADQTLLNRTDLRTEGAELLVQEHLPRLRRFGVPVFVSVTAPGVPGFRKIARYLQREVGEQLAGLEVYITAPHSGAGPDITARFVLEATEAVRNELRDDAAVIVKLPPWPDHIRGLALGAQEGGATALAATNTLKVLHLPTSAAAPLVGGLSGEALRPLSLRCVWELANDEKLHLPIFGTGGIFTLRDVQDYLRVGAQAVQVASGEWLSPGLSARLASEVEVTLSASSGRGLNQ